MMIEQKTVVDVTYLRLPEDIYDTLADFYECSNGSYHRYYPDTNWAYIASDIKEIINETLTEAGVVFPEGDKYFSILLYFSW